MRLRRRLLVPFLAACAAAWAPASAPADAPGPLSNAGRWLTATDGRVVVQHGVNMVYKRAPYTPEAAGFDAEDAAFLESLGFNTVRVGIIWKGVEPQPGQYDEAYIASIERTVNLLGAHGIESMLDFHQDLVHERFQGEGFPDWAVQDDGLPNQPQVGFPGNYVAMPALNRALDHFWANDPGPGGVGLQDRYAAAWRHVAERFATNPNVMGYDVMNEPWAGSVWPTCANPVGCPAFDSGPLTEMHERVLAAIRQVDPTGIVWAEPNPIFNFGAQTHLGDFADAATGFSFHNYCLAAGVVPGASLPNPPQDQVCGLTEQDLNFTYAVERGERNGEALMLSEFGATDDLGLLARMVDGSDRFALNWQYWHYCQCDDPTTSGTGGVQGIVNEADLPPTGSNVKEAKLDVLVRPYPRLVAGTPEGWSFDRQTRRFELAYSTAAAGDTALPAGAETEIFVPERHYPSGYSVAASGASVVSAPGARVLRLAPEAGATNVSVVVAPL